MATGTTVLLYALVKSPSELRDVHKTWTRVHGPGPQGWSMDRVHVLYTSRIKLLQNDMEVSDQEEICNEQLVEKKNNDFLQNDCGCFLGPKGGPCSSQFPQGAVLFNLNNCLGELGTVGSELGLIGCERGKCKVRTRWVRTRLGAKPASFLPTYRNLLLVRR